MLLSYIGIIDLLTVGFVIVSFTVVIDSVGGVGHV